MCLLQYRGDSASCVCWSSGAHARRHVCWPTELQMHHLTRIHCAQRSSHGLASLRCITVLRRRVNLIRITFQRVQRAPQEAHGLPRHCTHDPCSVAGQPCGSRISKCLSLHGAIRLANQCWQNNSPSRRARAAPRTGQDTGHGHYYTDKAKHRNRQTPSPRRRRPEGRRPSARTQQRTTTHSPYTRHTSRRRRSTRTPGPPPLPRRVAHAALVDDERGRTDRPHTTLH